MAHYYVSVAKNAELQTRCMMSEHNKKVSTMTKVKKHIRGKLQTL